MTSLPDNILHLPEYHVLGTKMEEHDLHYQVEAPEPLAACRSFRCTVRY